MDPVLEDLCHLLTLERIEANIFRGESRDIGSEQVFGGQVLGQALSAAQRTVDDDRCANSLHAYFLRRGDMEAPIVYEVDRQRDGRSFSVRRVVAIQHGRPILNMAASFQRPEEGLSHQFDMPDVPDPESLVDARDIARDVGELLPAKMRRFVTEERPFEFRPVEPPAFVAREEREPYKHVWVRAVDQLPDDANLHRAMLAYVSDYELLGTSALPHGLRYGTGQVQMASLDHALWFHRPLRVDEWFLYVMDSPNASSGRGFARGRIYRPDGILAASTAQEGVVRVWDDSRSQSSHPAEQK
ncbi:MAG: acyl-CoA thioesterase II [Pseudomonadota bacterium]